MSTHVLTCEGQFIGVILGSESVSFLREMGGDNLSDILLRVIALWVMELLGDSVPIGLGDHVGLIHEGMGTFNLWGGIGIAVMRMANRLGYTKGIQGRAFGVDMMLSDLIKFTAMVLCKKNPHVEPDPP